MPTKGGVDQCCFVALFACQGVTRSTAIARVKVAKQGYIRAAQYPAPGKDLGKHRSEEEDLVVHTRCSFPPTRCNPHARARGSFGIIDRTTLSLLRAFLSSCLSAFSFSKSS